MFQVIHFFIIKKRCVHFKAAKAFLFSEKQESMFLDDVFKGKILFHQTIFMHNK